MSERSFNFPVSVLIRDAQLLLGTLRSPIGAPVAKRLSATFAEAFSASIEQVTTGSIGQKSTSGHTGQLTQAQNIALAEVKRLTSSARETAKLAYAGNDVLLRQAFQVGNSDPVSLPAILERAITVQASCITYATALNEQGWLNQDTSAFATAIETLKGADDVQEASKGAKKAATSAKNTAANQLYARCQTIQNAVELEYPASNAATNETVVAARSRFLMDTFPPAPGSTPAAEPEPSGTAANPANPTTKTTS